MENCQSFSVEEAFSTAEKAYELGQVNNQVLTSLTSTTLPTQLGNIGNIIEEVIRALERFIVFAIGDLSSLDSVEKSGAYGFIWLVFFAIVLPLGLVFVLLVYFEVLPITTALLAFGIIVVVTFFFLYLTRQSIRSILSPYVRLAIDFRNFLRELQEILKKKAAWQSSLTGVFAPYVNVLSNVNS